MEAKAMDIMVKVLVLSGRCSREALAAFPNSRCSCRTDISL